MDVRLIDPFDDALLRRWHTITELAMRYRRPWVSVPSVESDRQRFRETNPFDRAEAVAAFDGEEMVGAGFVVLNLVSNVDKAWGGVAVEPRRRRRCIGSAVVGLLAERAAAGGGQVLLLQTSYPFEERETHPYRRFAEANGFALDLDEVHRVLSLPVSPEVLDRLTAEAADRHTGYRLASWVYDVPERYLDSWLEVHNLLARDAPAGVVPWEADAMDRTVYRREREQLAALGRELLTTVAISPDDEAVAFSDLVLQDGDSPRVSQWGTLVRRDHRGHRLGTAVKVANLRALQQRHPGRTEVHTTNAEVNAAMIGINETLGFRPVAVHASFYRRL
jgi:RimJ/RimL family protein N-acetyltransferase/predicted N-acetyltransferase YhbS